MTLMAPDIDDVTALLDLDFETTMISAMSTQREVLMSVTGDACLTGTDSNPPTGDLCCISARSHTGC